MRTFIVLALVFTAVNSSFLRELEEIQISKIEFTNTCIAIGSGTNAEAKVTLPDAKPVTGNFKATLSSGVDTNNIEATASIADTASATISFSGIDVSAKHTGAYKVTKVEDTADTPANTFKLPEENTATLTLSVTGTPGTQVADQEVIEGDSTKTSFKIVFTESFTAAKGGPVIYTDSEGKKPIADCSILAANLKEVVCKPTAEEMGDGGDVTIYYQNGCGTGKVVTTGATVKFTVVDSSAFMSLGKVALFAFALLF